MPGKMARSDPRPGVRATRGAGSSNTSRLSCKRAGKTRTLMPVWASSGKFQFNGICEMGRPWCAAFFQQIGDPCAPGERAKLSLHRKVWIEYETTVRKKEIDLWCSC